MIAKLDRTKSMATIGLVSVSILAFVFALPRTPNPVRATYSPAAALVATPAPVPSWSYTEPAQTRAKIPHAAKSAAAAKPAPVPAVAAALQPEPAPLAAAKEATVPAAESTATAKSEPAAVAAPAVASKNALDNVPEPAPSAAAKDAVVPAAGSTGAAISNPVAVAPDSKDVAVISKPSSAPALKTLPSKAKSPDQVAPSEPISPADTMVTGTTAALVLAPFVAPVSIVVGLVVGVLTPSAAQLGQVAEPPKPKAGTVTHTAPSSDSVY
ncbi:MAG TPA: hypothetical protein VMJ33_05910 [Gallionella sp.]|nr:hypothetical protein [Gallionella sp.]